jgi:UDP-3-O-[3-hydroxymyristoyl] glucosamine N-acyltransferase
LPTAHEIAAWVDGEVSGESAAAISRVSSSEAATSDALVFAITPAALLGALQSGAGLILSDSKTAAATDDARVVRVRDARLAFAIAAEHLKVHVEASIAPTAVIAGSASIGAGATIGPGAVIGEGVQIGNDCSIGARAVIEAGVVIGDRVRVQAGAVLGSLGFGYARRPDGSYLLFPQQGSLVIEDDVEIGANTTIDRGALGETRIGAGSKIDNLVHIAHNCRIGRNVIIAAQTGISGSSVVEDGAILGGQVGLGEHALVGPGVILGGGAGVLSNKKLNGPGQVFWGRPARPLKQYLRDLARLSRGR